MRVLEHHRLLLVLLVAGAWYLGPLLLRGAFCCVVGAGLLLLVAGRGDISRPSWPFSRNGMSAGRRCPRSRRCCRGGELVALRDPCFLATITRTGSLTPGDGRHPPRMNILARIAEHATSPQTRCAGGRSTDLSGGARPPGYEPAGHALTSHLGHCGLPPQRDGSGYATRRQSARARLAASATSGERFGTPDRLQPAPRRLRPSRGWRHERPRHPARRPRRRRSRAVLLGRSSASGSEPTRIALVPEGRG
jgi:hypothetical protein